MTTPIKIDPAIVEVARKAVAAQNSICRERLCPSLDCACGQFALAALQAAAPLLVAGERATIERLRAEKKAANSYAHEILEGRQKLIHERVAAEREACAKIAQDWDEQNAVALEIAAAIRQRGKQT